MTSRAEKESPQSARFETKCEVTSACSPCPPQAVTCLPNPIASPRTGSRSPQLRFPCGFYSIVSNTFRA